MTKYFLRLVVLCIVTGLIQLDCLMIPNERSDVEQLLELLEVNDGRMPNEMDVTFALDDQLIQLKLKKNRNVPSNAPLFVTNDAGNVVEWKSTDERSFATYTDPNAEASIVVEMKHEDGQIVKKFRGSVAIDGIHYVIEPSDSNRQRSANADELLVNIHGTEHVMSTERAELDFEDLYDTVGGDPHKRRLELEEYFEPRAGFQKYVVDMFLVLDYALYQRWYKNSKASDDNAKKQDAIQNLQYYFSHVASGVDVRYANIKESDFSINVRLVGYYVATTAADSQWTERPDVKIVYNNRGYSNMYKGLDIFEKWIPEVMPKLGITFDQATLFSGNNLFDGDYKDDGSPSAKSGLAEIEGICKLNKPRALAASINRELGVYSSIQTAAHEMGHNLGSQHDGSSNGCLGKDQYVMASAPRVLDSTNFLNPFKFSSCSVAYFRKYLGSIAAKDNCLLNTSPSPNVNVPPNFKPFPGNQYSVDVQCQNLFGPTSYYCAGGTFDNKICELMYCYLAEKKQCQTSAEQRAFDGTTCGKKKWCMNGKCVPDSRAPDAADTCLYGDFKATVGLDVENQMTCDEMGKQQKYRCYEAWVSLDCCDTCAKVRDKTKPVGCEYGDKDPKFCKTRTAKSYCYDPAFSKTCCESCGKVKGSIAGCEYGDKATWCATTTASACYDSHATCCEACQKFKQNNPGCEYGDKAPWCSTMTLSAALCNQGNTKDLCCSSCKKFKRAAAEDGDSGCTDNADWCSTIWPGWCNDPQTKTTCCKFCSEHKTGSDNCPYGDRYNWCKKDYCSTNSVECCSSCA